MLSVLAMLGAGGWAAAAPAPQAANPATGPTPATWAGGGKITAFRPASDWTQPGGPADLRRIFQPFVPLTLPIFGLDVNVGSGNEVTIAANPANPLNFVGGSNISNRFTTTDGGQTWNVGTLPGGGDPAVAFDAQGRAYFAQLGNTSTCPDNPYAWRSTDGGLTWTGPVVALTDPSPSDHFFDKEWMAADTSAASPYFGRIYYTASNYHTPPGCNLSAYIDDAIVLTFSTDQGSTWRSPYITVSDASHNQVQFSNPMVARDGTLYVGYQYQNCTYNCHGIPAYQMLAKSTDGGLSFSPSITLTGQPISYTGSSIGGYQYLYAGSTSSGFRHNDQAILGIAPTNPQELYAVWSDGRFESTFVYQGVTGWHGDIVFTRSTDGGVTWSPVVKISDDPVQGKDQFFPWMTVGSDGTIHVSWMDRRDAPVNGFPYREYYTQSTDGGLSWSVNQAVADVGSTPSSFIGDYSGIAVNSNNTRVLPIWTDQRSGQRAYTDPGIIAQSTPTVTMTGTPPTATSTRTPTASTTPSCQVAPAWQAGPTYTPARQYIQARVGTDGKYYTAGGWVTGGSGTTQTNDAARYNPATNTWEALPPLPVALGVYGMGAANGKIYVVGGSDIPTRTLTTTVQVFDITANSWSFGPSVPRSSGVQGPAVEVLNNKLYVIGGADNNAVYATNDILDLATNTWSTGAPLPVPIFLSGATVANGLLYVFGGGLDGNIATDALYAYNPATNSWATLAAANTGGLGQVGNISPYGPGTLLATDGTNSAFSVRSNTTHLYNIASNTWSPGPPLGNARYGQAQATLPDGRVMLYGGSTATGLAAPLVGGSRAPAGLAVPLPPSSSSEFLAPPPPVLCTPVPTSTPTITPTRTVTPGLPTQTATNAPATVTSTASATATATQGSGFNTPTVTTTPCSIQFTDVHPSDYFYTPVLYLACHGVVSGYGDETFRPYNQTTRAQMVKIVVLGFGIPAVTPTAPAGQTFADVPPTHPFYSLIETAAARQIVAGYTCGSTPTEPCDPNNRPYFRPYNNVTRGQLSKIVVIAAGWTLQNPTAGTFEDVLPGTAFYEFVETAACHGIISGYNCGGPGEPCGTPPRPYFRQYNDATRGQIAKIVYLAITAPASCVP